MADLIQNGEDKKGTTEGWKQIYKGDPVGQIEITQMHRNENPAVEFLILKTVPGMRFSERGSTVAR